MKVRNQRPYALEIPATGQLVEPGETVDVGDEFGASLVAQPDNWQPAKSTPKKENS